MSRAARITVGAVTAGCLLLVALIAGIMSAVSSGDGSFADEMFFGSPDSEAVAEVLDVDEDFGYVTLDVRWTTDDGEVVVTYIDWVAEDVPAVGDEVDVVYEAQDPEYTSYAADDPLLDDIGGSGLADEVEAAGASEDTGTAVGEAAGWVALAAVVLLLPTVVVTVVAAVRAPSPRREDQHPAYRGDPFAWHDVYAPGRPGPSPYGPPGHRDPGFQQPGAQQPGFPAPGYVPPGYPAPGYVPPGYPAPGYVPPGYAAGPSVHAPVAPGDATAGPGHVPAPGQAPTPPG